MPISLQLDSHKNILLIFYSICFGFPIVILNTPWFQLPLAVFIIPMALLALIVHPMTKEKLSFLLALLLSFILSALYSSVFAVPYHKSILSIIWFFTPYLFFFLGVVSIKNRASLIVFIRYMVYASVISCSIIFGDILLFHGGQVTVSTLNKFSLGVSLGRAYNGNILGFELYGSWGVNSLATYFLVIHVILVTFLINSMAKSKLFNSWVIVVFAITIYLIIFSLSRGAFLGLLLFYSLVFLYNFKKKKYLIYFVLGAFLVLFIIYIYGDYIYKIIEVKSSRHVSSINDNNYKDVLSGRYDIFSLMIKHLSENIFLGRGFSGFRVNGLPVSSPHNQYLGALWKMGTIASIAYFYFLYRVFIVGLTLKMLNDKLLSFIVYFLLISFWFLNLVWDNFTVPLVGYIIMFLAGSLYSVKNEKNTYFN